MQKAVLSGTMKRKYVLTALLTCVSIANILPLNAAETEWFETDGGNVRLLTEPFMAGAMSVRGVIDIDLLPGWKTYWRDPGAGGIPPAIQIDDVGLITATEIEFPVPTWISSKYGSYAGYDAPVQIPFTLQTNEPLVEQDISARIFIGICKDICIPAFTNFEISLTEATGSSRTGVAVAAAFDALPKPPKKIGVSVTATIVMDQKLAVEIEGDGGEYTLFVSGQNGEQFKRPKLVSAENGKTTFHVEPTELFDDGQQVEIMLTGQSREATFETSVPVVFNSQ